MKLLLDTHLLLRAAEGADCLPTKARELMETVGSELIFSVASLWEVVIKSTLNRADFHVDARTLRRGLIDNGYTELPVLSMHVMNVEALPPIHKDPFDRLLIAQASAEGITLLTNDAQVARYPGPIALA